MIFFLLKVNVEDAKDKFKNLRDYYNKVKSLKQKKMRSGSGAKKPRKEWCHLKFMSFLEKVNKKCKLVF